MSDSPPILSPSEAFDFLNELHRLPSRSHFTWRLQVARLDGWLRYYVSVVAPAHRKDGSLGRRRYVFHTESTIHPDEALVTAAMVLAKHLGRSWEDVRSEVGR